MANFKLGQDVANKIKRNRHSCSYLCPNLIYKKASLRFSNYHQSLWVVKVLEVSFAKQPGVERKTEETETELLLYNILP